MNTPESDQAQVEYAKTWLQKKLRKKMERLERRLEALAKLYFGEDIIIAYVPKEKVKGMVKEREDNEM